MRAAEASGVGRSCLLFGRKGLSIWKEEVQIYAPEVEDEFLEYWEFVLDVFLQTDERLIGALMSPREHFGGSNLGTRTL